MAIAELITDRDEFRETLRKDRAGWTGERNFRVRTINTTKAFFADGLPDIGDLWDPNGPPELANLSVIAVGPSALIGGVDDGSGGGGFTRIPVYYSTPQASGFTRLPANVGDRWTEISPTRGQVMSKVPIERNVEGGGATPVGPVANGEGGPLDVNGCEARVFTFRPRGAGYDLGRLLQLASPAKLNENPITLPPLYGGGALQQIGRGQAKYVSHEPSIVGDFLQIVHVLELSNDFLFRWRTEDANGDPTGPEILDRLNEYGNFTGLW